MLTVWGRRNSFNLQKVMWLVGELELPHTHIPAGGSYFEIDVKRPSVPHVEAWYRRLQERSAYREHIMLPFDELYGRLDYQRYPMPLFYAASITRTSRTTFPSFANAA